MIETILTEHFLDVENMTKRDPFDRPLVDTPSPARRRPRLAEDISLYDAYSGMYTYKGARDADLQQLTDEPPQEFGQGDDYDGFGCVTPPHQGELEEQPPDHSRVVAELTGAPSLLDRLNRTTVAHQDALFILNNAPVLRSPLSAVDFASSLLAVKIRYNIPWTAIDSTCGIFNAAVPDVVAAAVDGC
jgi:hypothetical protein